MAAKDRKPKRKPARKRINPVANTLRFGDDDGDDAGAAFAFDYLQHYRKARWPRPWSAGPIRTP
jgi:hypothetical protein